MPTLTAKEFVVVLENRPRALGELAGALGQAGINLTGHMAQAQGDYGVLRFTAADPRKAEAWLRASGRTYRVREAVLAHGVDEPGFLGRLAERVAAAGTNLEATYHAFVDGEAYVLLAVDDVPAARKALGG